MHIIKIAANYKQWDLSHNIVSLAPLKRVCPAFYSIAMWLIRSSRRMQPILNPYYSIRIDLYYIIATRNHATLERVSCPHTASYFFLVSPHRYWHINKLKHAPVFLKLMSLDQLVDFCDAHHLNKSMLAIKQIPFTADSIESLASVMTDESLTEPIMSTIIDNQSDIPYLTFDALTAAVFTDTWPIHVRQQFIRMLPESTTNITLKFSDNPQYNDVSTLFAQLGNQFPVPRIGRYNVFVSFRQAASVPSIRDGLVYMTDIIRTSLLARRSVSTCTFAYIVAILSFVHDDMADAHRILCSPYESAIADARIVISSINTYNRRLIRYRIPENNLVLKLNKRLQRLANIMMHFLPMRTVPDLPIKYAEMFSQPGQLKTCACCTQSPSFYPHN